VTSTAPSPTGTLRTQPAPRWSLRWLAPRCHTSLLTQSTVVAGRDRDCQVPLEGSEVSRRHARFSLVGAGVEVHDLGSKNGVVLNAERLRDRGAKLHAGDLVRIGDWLALVAITPEEPLDGWFREVLSDMWGGPELARIVAPVLKAAPKDLPIVIEGETGTGKECVALAVHALSGRRGSYRAINCTTLPETLAESELFGHRKGAFTGADQPSPGHLRAAEGGTLLLDEVSDLPLAVQPKLLRALEQREVVPIGEVRAIPIDVRVVATSQVALHELVAEGRFRADLFARLDGVTIRLPPLRERIGDVPPLFERLLRDRGDPRPIDVRLLERLCLYDWPGNVRELVHLIDRLLALHEGADTWTADLLPSRFERVRWRAGRPVAAGRAAKPRAQRRAKPARPRREPTAREEAELAALLDALRVTSGNLTHASERLGITRQRAYRLLALSDADIASIRRGHDP
jgi:two-component system, response regulator FlrC